MKPEERVMLAMSAYDVLLKNFRCFQTTWEETVKIAPGARITMACPGTATLFDGQDISMVFGMVFDADGSAWGKVSFNRRDHDAGETLWALYFDSLGNITEKPGARTPALCQTVSNHYKFSELLYMLVDRYLSSPRFKEDETK